MVTFKKWEGTDPEAAIDTLRIFMDCADFTYPEADGWQLLVALILSTAWLSNVRITSRTLLDWSLRQFKEDMLIGFVETMYAKILGLLFCFKLNDARGFLLKSAPLGSIKAVDRSGKVSSITQAVILDYLYLDFFPTLRPDLHYTGINPHCSPFKESPTSLAMYCPWKFHCWLTFLYRTNVNVEAFIENEIEQGPLSDLGWQRATLQSLFDHSFDPDFYLADKTQCEDCCKGGPVILVQPSWLYRLEIIKQGPVSRSTEEMQRTHRRVKWPSVEVFSDWINSYYNPNEQRHILDMKNSIYKQPTTDLDESNWGYEKDDIVCLRCWLHCRLNGKRRPPCKVNEVDDGEVDENDKRL